MTLCPEIFCLPIGTTSLIPVASGQSESDGISKDF
jgi:hypothetical protein